MMWAITSILPDIASSFGHEVDRVFWVIFWISFISFILVQGAIIYFIFKYRKGKLKEEEISESEGHLGLEITWTVIPTIVVMLIFLYGLYVFDNFQRRPPLNAMNITVVGHQWWWEFKYPNGQSVRDTLVVPVNKPVKLTLTSTDVIHSFFVPQFRIKEDAVPGRYTWAWFKAVKEGEYEILCAEYCGGLHSRMIGIVKVVSEEEYEKFLSSLASLSDVATLSPVERGKRLASMKGCTGCHTVDGSSSIGPTWKGLFGSKRLVVEDGKEKEVVADENYIRESIVNPNKQIVKGFNPIMPSYQGQLSEDEIMAIIEYIKTLK